MSNNLGMRGKDVRVFCMIAQKHKVYILVRQTNPESLGYIGKAGYYPKPAVIKAKTADLNPPPFSYLSGGQRRVVQHRIAGLVSNPWFQPDVYKGAKLAKAKDCWLDTLDIALSTDTWAYWGKEHLSTRTGWKWKIDIAPDSQHFGCLQISKDAIPWSYVHGDYDLKDVILLGAETFNERREGKIDGVKNYTPRLPNGLEFESIQRELNNEMGIDMVQHGSEAQFAWHGDEPITLIQPDGPNLQYRILGNAEAVQSWYQQLNRRLIAENGKDFIGDKSRWFWFGGHGNLFLPGKDRSALL
jgi:hypothetical protein